MYEDTVNQDGRRVSTAQVERRFNRVFIHSSHDKGILDAWLGDGYAPRKGKMRQTANVTRPTSIRESRESVETLIDEMGDHSFPASAPPTGGVSRARLSRTRE